MIRKLKIITASRKAQFFLFTAVLLSVMAFTLVKPKETSLQRDDTFKELYTNYIKEAGKAVDNALLDGVGVSSRFEDFNDEFKTFSNSKNIKFGFLGIAAYNETFVHNKLGSSVDISYGSTTQALSKDSIASINWSDQILVEFDDVVYRFNFTEGFTEVKGLFYAKTSDYEKIYVYN